jgi:Ca2+-binding EF-hand superfamily protein
MFQSNEGLATKLKNIFTEFDSDKSAVIIKDKLCSVLKQLDNSFNQSELDCLFEVADKNKDGVIQYNEFIDFVCFLGDDGKTSVPDAGMVRGPDDTTAADLVTKFKLMDTGHWKNVLASGSLIAFMADQQSSMIRSLVRNFPDLAAQSPEGLTLAEEFVLLWQNEETGKLAEYGFFGKDEPFHNALFGACLLGLRARDLLDFKFNDCPYLGNRYTLNLKGEAPTDSAVLKAVYDELASQPELALKGWFEKKSGKWGQDQTTKLVLSSLVERGVLEQGSEGDAMGVAEYPTKDPEIKKALKERLRKVASGEVDADNRSVALLALCRTADLRDSTTNVMMTQIFGKEAAESMAAAIDSKIQKVCQFAGVGCDALNLVIDEMQHDWIEKLCSDAAYGAAESKFKSIDKDGAGFIAGDGLTEAVPLSLTPKILEAMGCAQETQSKILMMFDVDQDGKLDLEEFTIFAVWAEALKLCNPSLA